VYAWADDPYFSEIKAFVADVEGKKGPRQVLSSFADAVKTYEFTWAIRDRSEGKPLEQNGANGHAKEVNGVNGV
jgi:hypothetical protein